MDPLTGWKTHPAPPPSIVGLPTPGTEVQGSDNFYSPRLSRTDRSATAPLSRLRCALGNVIGSMPPTLREAFAANFAVAAWHTAIFGAAGYS
jgi:hypothetical protein